MTLARLSIRQIEPSRENIFLLWEYDRTDKDALARLEACLRTLCFYNEHKRIYVFSNSLQEETLATARVGQNEVYIVDWTPQELSRDTPFEGPEMNFDPNEFGWRWFSDRFRLACVWRWGGTYTDTDNICMAKLPGEKNLLSRTYDPHSFDEKRFALIPGRHREGPDKRRYDHIPFRLRNDPLLNFEPRHPFLGSLVELRKHKEFPRGRSWQALLTRLYLEELEADADKVRAVLLLAYFPDGRGLFQFSDYDKCKHGGEICDILRRNCPDIRHVGNYQTHRREYAQNVMKNVYDSFPYCCFLWSKGHYGFRKHSPNKISNWLVQLILEEASGAG